VNREENKRREVYLSGEGCVEKTGGVTGARTTRAKEKNGNGKSESECTDKLSMAPKGGARKVHRRGRRGWGVSENEKNTHSDEERQGRAGVTEKERLKYGKKADKQKKNRQLEQAS